MNGAVEVRQIVVERLFSFLKKLIGVFMTNLVLKIAQKAFFENELRK